MLTTTSTHYAKRFQEDESNSGDLKQNEWWIKRYSVSAVENSPEPMELLRQGMVLFHQNSLEVVQRYDILEVPGGNTRR